MSDAPKIVESPVMPNAALIGSTDGLCVWRRAWAMPTANTFDCPPIREWVKKYLAAATWSADPFARNQTLATYTNDHDPDTTAQHHMEAGAFLEWLPEIPELVLFDPPYSPRQILEHYKAQGRKATQADCQNVRRKMERTIIARRQAVGGIVLSFGWNSTGMGKSLGYELIEGLLVNHGAAHNDTICVAERKTHNAKLRDAGESGVEST